MATLELLRGDICAQDTDAIVNAANTTLLGGGGVDGAIHARGGPSIVEECRKLRQEKYPKGLPVGQAVATSAGSLKARYVIHTVGPIYGRTPNPEAMLASCFLESLRVADELGLSSISFPAISTGAYAYPPDEAAAISFKAVREAKTGLSLIRFVLFDGVVFQAFSKAFRLLG